MNPFGERFYGNSPELESVLNSAHLVAMTDVTVLILGESGTGKELMARAIHDHSPRSSGPFISVNCASLSQELACSMLFGHRKGAFTGALADHAGYVEEANGGTLFLDEIGELAPPVQAKLLRFLESGESQALGAPRPRHHNVRVVAATNQDLLARVRSGEFRDDLYYRLQVVPIELPPLRERSGDVDVLLTQFTGELASLHGLPAPSYTRVARKALRQYSWPGNVRELRNFCERMLILLGGRAVDLENLPSVMLNPRQAQDETSFQLPPTGISLERLEADMIQQALARTAGNRTHAARLLGLTRDTLLYRIKKYAIQGNPG